MRRDVHAALHLIIRSDYTSNDNNEHTTTTTNNNNNNNRVVAREHADDRELRADNLSAGRRGADEAVVASRVERAERLRLNGVEDLVLMLSIYFVGLVCCLCVLPK